MCCISGGKLVRQTVGVRTWRRWKGFCSSIGIDHNPLLDHVPSDERELIIRGFLTAIRFGSWSNTGSFIGSRPRPVAGQTVRSAASSLASAFRSRVERSPLHIKNSPNYRPAIRDLLRAFENVDPPVQRQKAITPAFLRAVATNGTKRRPHQLLYRHASDLIIAAFFFACRSCEYTVTPSPGVTRRLAIRNIVFRDKRHRTIDHQDPTLHNRAVMVTVCFEHTKNRQKMEYRTHFLSDDRILCPVRRLIDIIQRIYQLVPNASPATDLCTILDDSLRPISINNTFILQYLRSTCLDYRGTTTFGFAPLDIGNKSIRSGTAMALFMARHTPDRIMLLGRWKSVTFMDYLRPQVLQWTSSLSSDMIQLDQFFDLSSSATLRPHRNTDNGHSPVKIPKLNVDFPRFNVDFDRIKTK